MRILAIETSCDETAIAITEFKPAQRSKKTETSIRQHSSDRNNIDAPNELLKIKVLSNIVSSQVKLHAKFGGVVPNLAKREHQKNLVPVFLKALKEAGLLKNPKHEAPAYVKTSAGKRNSKQHLNSKFQFLNSILEREPELLEKFKKYALPLKPPKIDAIAVTYGPGLEPALWVGINFAKALSYIWGKPIIPVDHMRGHLYSALIKEGKKIVKPDFPALALLVSGGHTELILMRGWDKFKIIGETLDDAAGEAFDKVARLLGLKYPGGPEIAGEAEKSIKHQLLSIKQIKLPRPMLNSPDFNFSFSGLKTAVLYLTRDLGFEQTKKLRPAIAAEFQNAVIQVLVSKTIRAAKKYNAKTLLLGGGVAANKLLQTKLAEEIKKQIPDTKYLIPDNNLTGDNALMIAVAAYFNQKKTTRNNIRAVGDLRLTG